MSRKRKNKIQKAKNTASHLSLVVALIGFGWLAIYSLAWQESQYLTEDEMEAISKSKSEPEPQPVKLKPMKEPKRMDAREAKLTYLFLYGNDKESAKARQLLANK